MALLDAERAQFVTASWWIECELFGTDVPLGAAQRPEVQHPLADEVDGETDDDSSAQGRDDRHRKSPCLKFQDLPLDFFL